MSKVVQFNFEKNTDKEIEINGVLYSIPMDDESKDKYILAVQKFGQTAEDVTAPNLSILAMTEEELKAFTGKQRESMKALIEAILGKGKFKVMYDLAGRSVIKLMPLVRELMKLVSDVDDETYEAELNKYLQNGKK